MASGDKAIYTIELNDRLSPGLKKAVAASIGFDKKMGGTSKKVGMGTKSLGGMAAMAGRLVPALGLATAAMGAFNLAASSMSAARNFESLTNAITFASGSAEEGAKNMKFLKDTAKELGTPLLAGAEGFKTLSASMMGTKLQGDATRRIYRQVNIAASAMGLGAEDAKGVFLALGQIMGKGKVQAEELRGQIGERVPGAFQIAAKAMGVTQARLNKLMEQGMLPAEEFLPRFANELEKTFGGALGKSTKSAQAQLNRFNNTWLKLKVTMGKALLPIAGFFMRIFQRIFGFFERHKKEIYENVILPIKELFKVGMQIYLELFNAISAGFGKTVTMSELFKQSLIVTGKVLRWFLGKMKTVLMGIKAMSKAISGVIINMRAELLKFSTFISEIFTGLAIAKRALLIGNFDIMEKGLSRVGNAMKTAQKSKAAFLKKEYNQLVKNNKLEGATASGKATPKSTLTKFGTFVPTGGDGGKESSTTVDSIKSGRPTHINIDIGKLIENMNITATDVDDLTGKIKDQVARALFSAVNNVNNIAGT